MTNNDRDYTKHRNYVLYSTASERKNRNNRAARLDTRFVYVEGGMKKGCGWTGEEDRSAEIENECCRREVGRIIQGRWTRIENDDLGGGGEVRLSRLRRESHKDNDDISGYLALFGTLNSSLKSRQGLSFNLGKFSLRCVCCVYEKTVCIRAIKGQEGREGEGAEL